MRLSALVPVLALVLGGCAKFPEDGRNTTTTRLSFRFRLADSLVSDNGGVRTLKNPNYLYVVAIRPQFATDPVDDGFGPTPVFLVSGDSNPKNGFVEGRPTRFIVFTPGIGQTGYQIRKFERRNPTSDDDNPIDLANISDIGEPISGADPTLEGNDPATLGFDIETRDLVDNADDVKRLAAIQFNILTMNKALRTRADANGRVTDALGDLSQVTTAGKGYFRAVLTTSNTYSNSRIPSGDPNHEPEGDEYPPGATLPTVDIIDWSLDVRPQ